MLDKATRIMATAEKLFMTRRFHEVTLDQVSREAGVGKGTIYRYFQDKEDLYHQIIFAGMADLVRSLQQGQPAGERSDNELHAVVGKVVDFFTGKHTLFALMHSEPARDPSRRKELRQAVHERSEQLVDAVAATISRGVQDGRYRNGLPPKAAARLLLGMVRAALWHKDSFPNGKDLCGMVTDLFENGLRAQSSSCCRERQR